MTRSHGFTLIEMAIVLVIITILIGGLAMPLSAQIQARRIAETNKTLEEAREAILGYAMTNTVQGSCQCKYSRENPGDPTSIYTLVPDSSSNPDSPPCLVSLCRPTTLSDTDLSLSVLRHYLPCPDTDNDGIEDRGLPDDAGACKEPVGLLPWVTLGTAAQDAWGNRLLYAVSKKFSNKTTGFFNTNKGDFQICDTSGCTALGNVAAEVPVVLVSHGPNGWGALNVNGTPLALPTGLDEAKNLDTRSQIYVSRSPYKPADGSAAEKAKEFDDLVRWISADQLRGRICPAGGCP